MHYIPNNVTDCIASALIDIEKSRTLLGDLDNDYAFPETLLIDWESANREARTWVWDYNKIRTLLDIISDYIYEVDKLLQKAQELDDANRAKGGASNG